MRYKYLLIMTILCCTVGACKDDPVPAAGTDETSQQSNPDGDQNTQSTDRPASCRNGYFGLNCDRRIFCENGIVNDGPDGDGHCKSCNDGWSGKDCDLPKTCQNGIANLGISGNGECSGCQSGWVGPNCDIPNNCLYGYVATADIESDGSCICDKGYEGKHCEKPEPTCEEANATGVDWSTGKCTGCKAPYFGKFCDKVASCNLGNTTNNLYDQSDGHCYAGTCKKPYFGPDCSQNSACNIDGTA